MAALAAIEPAGSDPGVLASLARDVTRLRAAVDALEARIAIELERLHEPAALTLIAGGRQSARCAEAAVGRARSCGLLPELHDALAAGEVSAGHAHAGGAARRAPHVRRSGVHGRFADCDVHHVVPWTNGGRTDLANLVPLRSRHHHEAHGELGKATRTSTWPRARAPAA